MTIATSFGSNAVLGFGIETTWGTRVTPTKFVEIMPNGCTIGLQQKTIAKATQGSLRQQYYIKGKRTWAGNVEIYTPYQGAEYLFYAAMGGTVTSTVISSGVYNNVFSLGNTLPVGLSFYWSPDYTNLGTAFAYAGGQCKSLTLSQEHENFLKLTAEFEGSDETQVTSSSPTYPTFYGVSWDQVTTLTANGTAYRCTMAEFKLENPLADARFKLGQRTRIGLGRGGVRKVTGKLALELDDLTAYALFQNLTQCAIVATWTGPVAGGANNYGLAITLPGVIFQGSPPKVNGAGPVTIEMPFEALYTGTGDEFQLTLTNLVTSVP